MVRRFDRAQRANSYMGEQTELLAANRASPTAQSDSRPWMIGGPARCGKSSLARAVAATRRGPAVLPVDALFPVYLKRRFPLFRRNKQKILCDYLLRPRYTVPDRSESARPIDAFRTPIDVVVDAALAERTGHHITLFAAALDQLAQEQGRQTWLAVDLHPELQFPVLRRLVPDLRLAVMLRDPREAIAASLYWRTFPERVDRGDRQIRYHLFLWLLSAQIGFAMAEAHPDSVTIIDFNKLIRGNDTRVNSALDLDPETFASAFDDLPLFSFDPGRGFLCPDRQWRPLLSTDEISLIETGAAHWLAKLDIAPAEKTSPRVIPSGYQLLLRVLLWIGRVDAATAKSVYELAIMPRVWWTRRIGQAKQRVKDILEARWPVTHPWAGRQ